MYKSFAIIKFRIWKIKLLITRRNITSNKMYHSLWTSVFTQLIYNIYDESCFYLVILMLKNILYENN